MHAVVELIVSVVVWMAVTALNHFGVQVSLPKTEPETERVITRENAENHQKAAANSQACPPPVRQPASAGASIA
ncbi:MAG: hypothetical protein QE280_15705 [Caulobacter sp.]|nr:hypothetical protein [Caulobacter sp.]